MNINAIATAVVKLVMIDCMSSLVVKPKYWLMKTATARDTINSVTFLLVNVTPPKNPLVGDVCYNYD